MANIIRAAKSGGDWTLNELDSYHITLNQLNPLQFFGVQVNGLFSLWLRTLTFASQEMPQPMVDQELLDNLEAATMEQDHHAELVTYLDLAMIPEKGETAVDDFAVELFRCLGYVRRERVARTRTDIPLLICGENRHVKTDVCIIDHTQHDILLLVQEDKRLEVVNAQAQLVAEAVAAFNQNNVQRETVGLPPLEEKASCLAVCGPFS